MNSFTRARFFSDVRRTPETPLEFGNVASLSSRLGDLAQGPPADGPPVLGVII